MSKESYARGFCKVAEAHGIDPMQLAKHAAEMNGAKDQKTKPATPDSKTLAFIDKIKKAKSSKSSGKGSMPGSSSKC